MLKINNNLAQTGLRVLFVMQLLLRGPVSKAQIMEEISKNPNLKEVTADTVTLDINTLKSAGFEIISGNKSNNYCYELKLIPIKIKFTKKEMRVLLGTKKALFQFMDFRYIISLYEVFEKISKLIESDEQAESLLNFGNILRTNFKTLKELDVHCKHKNEIVVFYASPSGKKREMTLRCEKIEYSKKNDKLYLWGFCEQYGIVYLRTDHIKKIVKISKVNSQLDIKPRECLYKISNDCSVPVGINKDAKILKIEKDYVLIRQEYLSEFNLIQKILSCGSNLIEIQNEDINRKVLKIIQDVRGMYS